MQRIFEYHRYAEDCRKFAELLVNPRHKQKLQEMAAAWDMLAIERKLELDEKKPDCEVGPAPLHQKFHFWNPCDPKNLIDTWTALVISAAYTTIN